MDNKDEYPIYNRILWIEDDIYLQTEFQEVFVSKGFEIITAKTADEGYERITENDGEFDLIIMDVRLKSEELFPPDIVHGGHKTGVALCAKIKKEYPELLVVGFSAVDNIDIKRFFENQAEGYILKNQHVSNPNSLFSRIESIIFKKKGANRKPEIFIVHGQDEKTKYEMKNYLQNVLNLSEPTILHEKPNIGRTIIEKFEHESKNIDLVFVLLTPDDKIVSNTDDNQEKRRARQNVIFELGYFYGRYGRESGKIILCHKGKIELPSDISGIVYIDISNGIDKSGEEIRRELSEWL